MSRYVCCSEVTIYYVKGCPYAPEDELWKQVVVSWRNLHSDDEVLFA